MPAPTFDAHRNLAVSSIAVAPAPPTSGTSITVGSGEGGRFPAVPFNATIGQPAALLTPLNAEIVRVTAVSGDVFTITRAQEGTAARSIAVGDLIGATITAKTITDIEGGFTGAARTDLANVFTQSQTIYGAGAPSLFFTDTSQIANSRVFQVADYNQTFLIQSMNDGLTVVAAVPLTLTRGGDAQVGRDLYEKGRTTPLGHWTDVAFNAANFTGSPSGSFSITSGQVTVNAYTLIGKTLIWALQIAAASVASGSPTGMIINAPVSTLKAGVTALGYLNLNGVANIPGYVQTANASQILVSRGDGATWAGSFYIYFCAAMALL